MFCRYVLYLRKRSIFSLVHNKRTQHHFFRDGPFLIRAAAVLLISEEYLLYCTGSNKYEYIRRYPICCSDRFLLVHMILMYGAIRDKVMALA